MNFQSQNEDLKQDKTPVKEAKFEHPDSKIKKQFFYGSWCAWYEK